MREPVHFLPIATTLIAFPFAWVLMRRYLERRSGPHLLWWAIGVFLYGRRHVLGGFGNTIRVARRPVPGVVHFGRASGRCATRARDRVPHLPRRAANRLALLLATFVAIAALFVLLSPIDLTAVEPYRLSGRVLEWRWVRFFSPFVNTYAAIFLIGGAILSANRYRKRTDARHRFIGNVLIATSAILPGIGGAATRMGHTEVLYVGELIGIMLIWLGYRFNVSAPMGESPRPNIAAQSRSAGLS